MEMFAKNYRKGTLTKATWKSETIVNGETMVKVSSGVVRFVNYGNTKKAKAKATINQPKKTNTNTIEIIKDILTYNQNTNNYLVKLFVSQNPLAKVKTIYTRNGIEITKEEFETIVKPKNYGEIDLMFIKKLEDIISLG